MSIDLIRFVRTSLRSRRRNRDDSVGKKVEQDCCSSQGEEKRNWIRFGTSRSKRRRRDSDRVQTWESEGIEKLES